MTVMTSMFRTSSVALLACALWLSMPGCAPTGPDGFGEIQVTQGAATVQRHDRSFTIEAGQALQA